MEGTCLYPPLSNSLLDFFHETLSQTESKIKTLKSSGWDLPVSSFRSFYGFQPMSTAVYRSHKSPNKLFFGDLTPFLTLSGTLHRAAQAHFQMQGNVLYLQKTSIPLAGFIVESALELCRLVSFTQRRHSEKVLFWISFAELRRIFTTRIFFPENI